MAGPWEKYQQAAPTGPWEKYAAPVEEAPAGPVQYDEQFGPPRPRTRQDVMKQAASGRSGHLTDVDRMKASGIGQGVKDVGLGVDQMLAHALLPPQVASWVDDIIAHDASAYEKRRAQAGVEGFDGSRAVGNALPLLPAALVAPEGLIAAALAGAGSGAIAGATRPVYDTSQGDFWEQKGTNTAIGAGTGAAVQGAGTAIAKVVAPKVAPYVKKLLEKGVTPTPGQILGGMANKVEERLSGIPFVGDMMAAGRRRAQGEFNTAVANETLAPIGKTTTAAPGRNLVADVEKQIGAEYDRILANVTFKQDMQLAMEVGQLRSAAAGKLPEQEARTFESEIADITKKLQHGGQMSGAEFKVADSHLGELAAKFKASTDAYQRQLGDYLIELQSAMRQSLPRTNPNYAEPLNKANEAWSKFKRMQRASTTVGTQTTEPGIFTGDQFQAAVKAMDASKDNGAFARGAAPMQDLSDAAKSVLGARVPNSGTPERLATMMMGGGGLAYLEPTTLAASGALTLPYTPIGQKALAAALARRPAGAAGVRKTIEELTPAARQALVAALLNSSLLGPASAP